MTAVLPNALAIAAAAACRGVTQSGYWTTYDVTDFPGGGDITSFAIDAFDPETMYATDGKTVKRTTDAGCNWRNVYSVVGKTPADQGFVGDVATITAIEIPRTPGAGDRVYLLVREAVQGVVRPHVVRSDTGGDAWVAASVGLSPAGEPEALVVSPLVPEIAYLGVDAGGGALDFIYRTTDAGVTWTLRNDLTKTQPNRNVQRLALNPLNPEELWAYGTGGLLRSNDGGASFESIPDFDNGSELSEFEVFQAPSRTIPILLAFRSSHDDMRVSRDNDETWPRVPTPGAVDSAAYGRTPNELVISINGRLYFFDPASSDWFGIEVPRPGITGLVSDMMLEQDFYGRTGGTIEKYDGPVSRFSDADGGGGGPIFEAPGLIPPDVQKPAPPALGPPDAKVRMKTGAKKTVDYRLKLSAKQTPLDVFFLLDTSDTMSGTIQGLIDSVGGIINQLNAAGLDAHFGIGVSRAYTDTLVPRDPCESEDQQNCERNFIYRRLVDLADYSNHEQLEAALESLRAEAGGRFDSQLGALWAIATGEEIDDVPEGTEEPSDVPAGQDASFRDEALKLIFVATDEPFATGDEGARDFTISDFGRIVPPDIPSYQKVAEAVLKADAQVLGLAIGDTVKTGRDSVNGGAPTALKSMRKIAGLTDAIAPEGGVDCNGDGVADLAAGDALVCPVRKHNVADGKNLAAAITKLVEAVRGTTEYELEVVRGEDVVAGITPESYPSVVRQKPNLLDFEVTYRCPDRLQGKNVTVELAAVGAAGTTLDSVTTTVACLEEKVEPPLPIEPTIFLGLVIPPVLPPAPPPIAANAPSAQGQAQSQSQAQAQGAMAHQEQEQAQLAYVGATLDHREALEEELAMSDHRRRSEVPQWATLGTGAVMMSLAYGWLSLSRQRSFRVQRVRRY